MTISKSTIKQLHVLQRWRELEQLKTSTALMLAIKEKSLSEQALAKANANLLLAQQEQRLLQQSGREFDPSRYANHLAYGEMAAMQVSEKRDQVVESQQKLASRRENLTEAQIKLQISQKALETKQLEYAQMLESREYKDSADKQNQTQGTRK